MDVVIKVMIEQFGLATIIIVIHVCVVAELVRGRSYNARYTLGGRGSLGTGE